MATQVEIHSATSSTSKTYAFTNEDHTLGNSLRYVLMRDPHVSLCGYTVPHPSEPKMHLRLQTNGENADETLATGVQTLRSLSAHIGDTLNKELERFRNNKSN